jgi:hypothetical protein
MNNTENTEPISAQQEEAARAERARALDLSIRATAGETPFAYMYPGSNGFGTWD